jgi:hypothetical protein
MQEHDCAGERKQRGRAPRQRIDNGEIPGSISSKQTLRVEKVQHASCKKKKKRYRRRWKSLRRNAPDNERNQEQRLKDGSEPDELFVLDKPLCQEVPNRMGCGGKKNEEKRAYWQDRLPDTQSRFDFSLWDFCPWVRTVRSFVALGPVSINQNPSHRIPSTKSSLMKLRVPTQTELPSA